MAVDRRNAGLYRCLDVWGADKLMQPTAWSKRCRSLTFVAPAFRTYQHCLSTGRDTKVQLSGTDQNILHSCNFLIKYPLLNYINLHNMKKKDPTNFTDVIINLHCHQWRTQKIFMGRVSFSCIWWSFVFGVRFLWRHNLTSYSCFQAKFVDIIGIFFYMHSPYFCKNQAVYTPLMIKCL